MLSWLTSASHAISERKYPWNILS